MSDGSRHPLKGLRRFLQERRLPAAARLELSRDRGGLPSQDPGIDRCVDASVAWLARAQDRSASADGGVARDFSLIKGWATSYPETTGYIVPTFLAYAGRSQAEDIRVRAKRMLDWLVSIQLPGGGFQGGRIDSQPVVPVTFNTGQILLGLASGVREFGNAYLEPMRSAARWLAQTQDDDGCWRRFPTPFAAPGEKSYETHVAWGLFEAARVAPEQGIERAGLANVHWALRWQSDDGWLERCCLTQPERPLTHTLGYALRGIIEAYRFSEEAVFLHAACRTADGLLSVIGDDGFLAGRLRSGWKPATDWVCLTGSAQIAHCYLLLHQVTQELKYRDAGFRLNRFVRQTISVDGSPDTRGGVKGSFPVDGSYGRFEYLNWAAKFCIDSNLLEHEIRRSTRHAIPPPESHSEISEV